MAKGFFDRMNQWATRFLIYPGDDKETLLRKKIWLIIIACFLFFNFSDGLINLSIGNIKIEDFGLGILRYFLRLCV